MAQQFTKSIIVKADVDTVFDLWANFENFPQFMKYIERVTKTGPRTSRWQMAGPLGANVEWEAETTRLDENTRIGWNTKDRSGLTTSGDVTFTSLPQNQTQVTVTLQYDPPAGAVGEFFANIFADPEKRVEEDLYNFKRYAEMQQNLA